MFLPPSTGLLLGFSAGKGVNKCTQLVRLGCLMATWRPVSPLEGPQHKGHLVDVSLVGACGGGQERPRDPMSGDPFPKHSCRARNFQRSEKPRLKQS